MYRLLNRPRSLTRSKNYISIIFKCFSCGLKTFQTGQFITPISVNKVYNFLPSNKFCTQSEDLSAEYISEEDIKRISAGDSELEHKLRVIILEADVMRQDGKCVPSFSYMKHQHWIELLSLQTRTARSKYLTFLFKTEKKVENKAAKKEEQRLRRESEPRMEFPDDGKIRYGLGGNHMFLRIYETTMHNMFNNKLVQAMRFGQKLIVDCGFNNNMNTRENSLCAKQLMLVFSENRYHDDPFDLHFCNLQKNDNRLHDSLYRFMPPMYDLDFPLNLHEISYLDIFPKEKLIYLTPHCRDEMTEFDHDALYIIGGIVDKVNNEPLTLAKAKEEGIRMLKLPLDRYLHWGSGSGKSLTINQVTSILLDIKQTGDWAHSLRHVPRRKIVQYDQLQSVRKPEETCHLNSSLPVSQQLLQATRRSSNNNNLYREDLGSVDNESTIGPHINWRTSDFCDNIEDDRMTKRLGDKPTSFRPSWKPQRTNNDESKKERNLIDIKHILKSDR